MWQIKELSVTLQHLILLLGLLEYEKFENFGDSNGKFGDLPTELLSGECGTPPPMPL